MIFFFTFFYIFLSGINSPYPVGISATAISTDSTVLTATNEHPTWDSRWVTEGLLLYCCSVFRCMYSNDLVRQVVWWLQAQIPCCQQTWASDRYVVQKVSTINLVLKLVMKAHLLFNCRELATLRVKPWIRRSRPTEPNYLQKQLESQLI